MISIFLPIKKTSRRIPNKNISRIKNYKYGLTEIKLNQLKKLFFLLKKKEINCDITVSTDSPIVKKYVSSLPWVNLHDRPNHLAKDDCLDSLIKEVPKMCKSKFILWTHVTSPFFDEKNYSEAIKTYKKNIKKYDTLIGANIIQDFIFDKTKPYNYNPKKTYWPNTQTLKKLYKINNTIFLTSAKIYLKVKNRIGKKLFFYNVEKINSIDIDNIDDFNLSEKIVSTK